MDINGKMDAGIAEKEYTMTDLEAITKSHDHHVLMRTTVLHSDLGKRGGEKWPKCISGWLEIKISEGLFSDHCALCQKYLYRKEKCHNCPLDLDGNNCLEYESIWHDLASAENRRDYLRASAVMIRTLARLRDEYARKEKQG